MTPELKQALKDLNALDKLQTDESWDECFKTLKLISRITDDMISEINP